MNVHHLIEPGGRGGVYQHVLELARTKVLGPGQYVLHTATDSEFEPDLDGLRYCHCVRWGRRGPKPFRSLTTVVSVFFVLPAHLLVELRKRDGQFEVHGQFARGGYAWLVLLLALLRSEFTYVPHNLFARNGGVVARWLLSFTMRIAPQLVVFDESQRKLVRRHVIVRELVQFAPPVEEGNVSYWRSRFGARNAFLFAGQVRPDKNAPLVIEAAKLLGRECVVVVAGEDKGDLKNVLAVAANTRGVETIVREGYLSLEEIAALMLAADAVVCPYSVASQSGVAALARRLGRPVVSARVGALTRQATHTYDPQSRRSLEDLAAAMNEAVGSVRRSTS